MRPDGPRPVRAVTVGVSVGELHCRLILTFGSGFRRRGRVIKNPEMGFGKLVQGTRRHNLVFFTDLAAVSEPEGLRLTFTLPAGSYATILLREIMKKDVEDEDPA